MAMPELVCTGSESDGKILKVHKSLYGHILAAKMFWQHLSDNLTGTSNSKNPKKGKRIKGLGFKKSDNDHCLFTRSDAVFIFWIDDGLLIHKDSSVADQVTSGLKKAGMDLQKEAKEGGLENYLRVQLCKSPDPSSDELILKQTGLIDRIIEATGLQDANQKDTPSTKVLTRKPQPTSLRPPLQYEARDRNAWISGQCYKTRNSLSAGLVRSKPSGGTSQGNEKARILPEGDER